MQSVQDIGIKYLLHLIKKITQGLSFIANNESRIRETAVTLTRDKNARGNPLVTDK